MQTKDSLFLLIKSLTPSEKRYFKLEASKYSSGDSDNDYLRLYELLDKEDDYDEKAFKKSLKGDRMLKRFASIKNYLYNLLLKSLAQMHAERNVYTKLHHLLQQIAILYNKGLYNNCNKKLRQAYKLANDCQRYEYLVVLNRWTLRLAEFEKTYEKSQLRIEETLAEKQKTLSMLQLENDIETLYTEIETYTRGRARNDEEAKYFLEYLDHKNFLAAKDSASVYSKCIAFGLEDICNFMAGCPKEKILDISYQRLKVFDDLSDALLFDNAYYYGAAMFGHLQSLLELEKYDDFEVALNNCKQFQKKHGAKFDGFTDNVFYLTINYFSTKYPRLIGDFDTIEKIGAELKSGYVKRVEKGYQDRALYIIPLNIAFGYLVRKNYDEALFWLQAVINDKRNTVRPDVLGVAHICHLILQYEIGNYSILDYQVDRAQRFLSKQSQLYTFEKSFLSFFKAIRKLTSWDYKYKEAFEKLKGQLQELVNKGAFEKSYIETLYFIPWVDSKLKKQSFEQAILDHLKEK